MNMYNETLYKAYWLPSRWDMCLQMTILDFFALDKKKKIKNNATTYPVMQKSGSSIPLATFKENTLQHLASTVYYNYSKVTIFLLLATLYKLSHAFTTILNTFLVPSKSMNLCVSIHLVHLTQPVVVH